MNKNIWQPVVLFAISLLIGSCGGGGSGGSGGIGIAGTGTAVNVGGSGAAQGDGAANAGGASSSGAAGGVSSAAAAGGDDGSGVGSGGTGVSSASAAGIGSTDGLGSVILNGVRYNTDSAVFNLQDAPELLLGMSVKVTGPVNSNFTAGTAATVESAADLRGTVSNIDLASSTFSLLGTTVSTDEETVWADASGLSGIADGSTLQVWGLPAAPGMLRATRIARVASGGAPILTGTVRNLDKVAGVFSIGTLNVNYANALFVGGLDSATLANGTIVRVRGVGFASAGALNATALQSWYSLAQATGQTATLDGVVTEYAGLASLKVLGVPVDAGTAQITGGPSSSIGNGVKLEVAGVFSAGMLRATKVKIRHISGTGGPSSFALIGTVGGFTSAADFKVRGQPINASGQNVLFQNGIVGNLGNGVKVTVTGSQVLNGVLLANTVTFN
ncbi:hypothetical protein H7F36_01120 [Variovorax sp. PAMC28562]|nr:hypothetical protein H7F36_01120 [Variovorax sp. PAMC28562]